MGRLWSSMLKKSDVFLVILAADFVFYRCSRYKALLRILHDITVRIQNLICLFMGGIGCELLFVSPGQKKQSRTYIPFTKTSLAQVIWNVKRSLLVLLATKKSSTHWHSSPDYVQQPTLLCLAGVWDSRLVIWGRFRGIFWKPKKQCANTFFGERDLFIDFIYIYICIYYILIFCMIHTTILTQMNVELWK